MTDPYGWTSARDIDAWTQHEETISPECPCGESTNPLHVFVCDTAAEAERDTEPPPTRLDPRELIRAAADALPNATPWRGMAAALRCHAANPGEPCCGCGDNHVYELGHEAHWLSGSWETLNGLHHAFAEPVGVAYDHVEQAIDLLTSETEAIFRAKNRARDFG